MAGNGIEPFGESPLASVRRMNVGQQAALASAFLLVVGLMYVVSQLGSSPTMTILFSDLEPTAAAEIVDELASRGIEYELSDNGRVVWVPQNMVSEVRIDLSAAGLPDTASGWSILDGQGITSSDFDQRVGYRRAMEGELARTITVIDTVASANVHLVIPEQDLFVDDQIKASASVLLQMEGPESLSPSQVDAVVHLVASSVEGLGPRDVTVTDGSGRLLAGGGEETSLAMESDNQRRMSESFEADLENELDKLLTAVVGHGRSVVSVSADLDFDAVLTKQEEFVEPVNAEGLTLPQAETTRTEQYDNGSGGEEGVVDIETEILDGPAASSNGRTNYLLNERDVSYALNSVVTTTEKTPGAIKSISVAVVIDEDVVDAGRLPEIEGIVAAAVGSDPTRGDVITVNLLPFDISLEEQQQQEEELAAALEGAGAPASSMLPLIRSVGAVVVALVVLVAGLFMLRRASRRQVIDSIDVAALNSGSSAVEAGTDQVESDPTMQTPVIDGHGQGEDDLYELITNQPDDMAAVLRQWLAQPERSR